MYDDIKKYEPLWGKWYVEGLIGQGSYGKVYEVRRTELGRPYDSAVKIITIPQDKSEIQRLKLEGLDEASIRKFFSVSAKNIVSEIDLMRKFSGTDHIVDLEDHMIVENTHDISWDILIRMELLKSLPAHAAENPMCA
ncbi:MAG: serine/threonine protein kinase, partial [Peptococcaceae bacterium]|nr:serine/threonine protein kinase [Peptococcaceae bacterium]